MAHAHDQLSSHEVTYESTLRALGAFLDEQKGSRVRVEAVPGGFEVTFQHEPRQPNSTRQILRQDQLAARACGPHDSERRLSRTDSETRLTYENLFRSLGRELQEASGQLVLLEEEDDCIALTYRHFGRASGSVPYTRQVKLSRADAWSLLAAGVQRRRNRPKVIIGSAPSRGGSGS